MPERIVAITIADQFMHKMITLTVYLVVCSSVIISSNTSVSAISYRNEDDDSSSPAENQTSYQNLPNQDHGQHFCINSTTKVYSCPLITCTSDGPKLDSGFCATYNEDTRSLSIASCPYFQPLANGFRKSKHEKMIIELPNNLSQLNDYMCGPLNRKGLVCSECVDGFGPSVTSFGYRCVNCTGAWYNLPLYILLDFVPVTIFYFIILVFQISLTSAPMPCFILYAQLVVVSFYLSVFNDNSLREAIYTEVGHLRLDMLVIHILYGVFNLDFFQFLKPVLCINSHIKSIHMAFLGYVSVLYPIVLIFLTWLCFEIHGRNFRPLVWLWRPFHRCFVRLRRSWDTKSDIIDVFATFFLLSYSRCAYQTILLLSNQDIRSYNEKGDGYKVDHRAVVDLRIVFGSREHLFYMLPTVIIFLVYNVLPPLLLILYPIKAFRSCLSKCRLDFIAVNIFVEKLNCCYRNGLDGGRDMRSLCGLYFYLRMAVFIVGLAGYRLFRGYTGNVWTINEIWFPSGTLFMLTALMIALVKPYQKKYMSYVDALLFSNLALCCFVATSKVFTLLVIKILFVLPMLTLILALLLRKVQLSTFFKNNISKHCCKIRRQNTSSFGQNFSVEEQLPFIQSATMGAGFNDYGTKYTY